MAYKVLVWKLNMVLNIIHILLDLINNNKGNSGS